MNGDRVNGAADLRADLVDHVFNAKGAPHAHKAMLPHAADSLDFMSGKALYHAETNLLPNMPTEILQSQALNQTARQRIVRSNSELWSEADIVPGGAIAPRLVLDKEMGTVQNLVRKGFDKVIGPAIDAAIRKPMATHYFRESYNQTKKAMGAMEDGQLFNRILPQVFDPTVGVAAMPITNMAEAELVDHVRNAYRVLDPSILERNIGDRELVDAFHRLYRDPNMAVKQRLAAAANDPTTWTPEVVASASVLGEAPLWAIPLRYAETPGRGYYELFKDHLGEDGVVDIGRRQSAQRSQRRYIDSYDRRVQQLVDESRSLDERILLGKNMIADRSSDLRAATADADLYDKNPLHVVPTEQTIAAKRELAKAKRRLRDKERAHANGKLVAPRIAMPGDMPQVSILANDPAAPLREAIAPFEQTAAEARAALDAFRQNPVLPVDTVLAADEHAAWIAQRERELNVAYQAAESERFQAIRRHWDASDKVADTYRRSRPLVVQRYDELRGRVKLLTEQRTRHEAILDGWKEAVPEGLGRWGATRTEARAAINAERGRLRQEVAQLRQTHEVAKLRVQAGSDPGTAGVGALQGRITSRQNRIAKLDADLATLKTKPIRPGVLDKYDRRIAQYQTEIKELAPLRKKLTTAELAKARKAAIEAASAQATEDAAQYALRPFREQLTKAEAAHQAAVAEARETQMAQLRYARNDAIDDVDAYYRQMDKLRKDQQNIRFDPYRNMSPAEMERMFPGVEDELQYALETSDLAASALRSAHLNKSHIQSVLAETARDRAILTGLNFIDSHEIRSQFGELVKSFSPFWYAEENFLKRWARTLEVNPAAIRKMQLLMNGMKSSGMIYTDANGNDWFIYPGSGLATSAFGKLPIVGDIVPAGAVFAAEPSSMLPGFDFSKTGQPQASPLVSLPLRWVTSMFPELQETRDAILGPGAEGRGYLDELIPATIRRGLDAIMGNEDSSKRYASAMMAAIQVLQANGMGIDEDATESEKEEFLARVRSSTRTTLIAQTVFGFISPGAPVALWTGESTASFSNFTGHEVSSLTTELRKEYLDLVFAVGVEEGTRVWLASHADHPVGDIINPLALTMSQTGTKSGAPIPSTQAAVDFYEQNEGWMKEYPNAGAWLIPPNKDPESAFDAYAYQEQVAARLRMRRTPAEFLDSMLFKQGANMYFAEKDRYESARDGLMREEDLNQRKILDETWKNFDAFYKTAHPTFAAELAGGQARERRDKVLTEMRKLVQDPFTPPTPELSQYEELVNAFDDYKMRLATLGTDAEDTRTKERLKSAWETWGESFVLFNPHMQAFWLSIVRPESQL
jgi:hypothetical protein